MPQGRIGANSGGTDATGGTRFYDNDRWQGSFSVDTLGRYEYSGEAWIDRFASWRHELSKKAGAGQDVSLELLEGATLVGAAIDQTRDAATSGLPSIDPISPCVKPSKSWSTITDR